MLWTCECGARVGAPCGEIMWRRALGGMMSHCAVQKRNVCALRKKWDAARTGVSCRPGCPIGAQSAPKKARGPVRRAGTAPSPEAGAARSRAPIVQKAAYAPKPSWIVFHRCGCGLRRRTSALNLGASAKFSGSTLSREGWGGSSGQSSLRQFSEKAFRT